MGFHRQRMSLQIYRSLFITFQWSWNDFFSGKQRDEKIWNFWLYCVSSTWICLFSGLKLPVPDILIAQSTIFNFLCVWHKALSYSLHCCFIVIISLSISIVQRNQLHFRDEYRTQSASGKKTTKGKPKQSEEEEKKEREQ